MSKDNQESTNNKNTEIHLILETRLNGLEETVKLIKEKMIKPNSDSIEELEQNTKGSFEKVEDHIKRISTVIDVNANSIDELKESLPNYECMNDADFEHVFKQQIKIIADYAELEQKLSEVKILAMAKAIVVPEGKAIMWNNKLEALEKKSLTSAQVDLISHTKSRLDYHIEKQNKEIAELKEWMDCPCSDVELIKEVLREILDWFKKNDYMPGGYADALAAKLDGEKPSAIVGDLDPKETLGFEDWQIELLEKLREWFPQAQREICHHVYTTEYPFWECGKCGYHSFARSFSDNEALKPLRESLQPHKEYPCVGTNPPMESIGDQIIKDFNRNNETNYILVAREELEDMINQGKKTCNRNKDLWWTRMKEKYLSDSVMKEEQK